MLLALPNANPDKLTQTLETAAQHELSPEYEQPLALTMRVIFSAQNGFDYIQSGFHGWMSPELSEATPSAAPSAT